MEQRTYIRYLLLIGFAGLFALSAYVLLSYFGESRKQEEAFDGLEELAWIGESSLVSDSSPAPEKPADIKSEPAMLPGYADLYAQNPDFFGWIYIESTNVSYPVMFTPEEPEYYLHRAFDGSESSGGVPFLDASCPEDGGNYLIYGHNMSGGTMFAPLLSYADESFYEEHPVIGFDTLYERGTYEVMAVLYSRVYSMEEEGVFRYYGYTDLRDPERFAEYVKEIKEVALYPTGVTAEYGDQLLTLSTCSYHTENGRFVVIARKVR